VGEQHGETPVAGAGVGATRSQHVVLQGPADLRMMAAAMRPGLERSRGEQDRSAPACIVVTPTSEQALSAAEQARILLGNAALRVVPVSAVARAKRVIATGPVAVIVGTAADLLELRRASSFKLDALRAVVIIGLDEILRDGGMDTVQALLGDAPEELQRIVTLEEESPEADAFLESQLRRARRIVLTNASDAALPMTPSYAITTAAGRAETLRAILDAVDPPSLVVVASSDEGLQEAERALARVGLVVDGSSVQVVKQPTSQHVSLVVLWETPATFEALNDAIATRPVDAVALLLPDELPAFRRITNGLAEVWNPPARLQAAETRTRTLRTALRATLANAGGASASEMALLAPLLDAHDALEIAAAALRLYEGARRDAVTLRGKVAAAAARVMPAAPARGPLTVVAGGSGKQRVFLAVGKRDNVRVGDVVGAVANEAGIPGERIGSVELFESHSIVELTPEDAARTVEALSDASLRGRRLSARIDERSDTRGSSPRKERTFGPPRADRADRAPRGDRPMRSFDRGDRPDRSERPDRAPRSGPRDYAPPRDRAPRDGAPRDRAPRDYAPRDSAPRDRAPGDEGARGAYGESEHGPRSGPRGGAGAGRGPVRADEARLAFGDRPVRERAEGKVEWSERGARMQHAKRPPRPATPDTPSSDRDGEA